MKSVLISQDAWDEYRKQAAKVGVDSLNEQDMDEVLQEVAAAILLAKPPAMVNGGAYGYIPKNTSLTTWVATDGSLIRTSLLGILMLYASDSEWIADLLSSGDTDSIIRDYVVVRAQKQEDFEAKALTGSL